MTPETSSVVFLLPPGLEILDMAGPLQAFSEATHAGADLQIRFCSSEPRVQTDQGLWLSDLEPLPQPSPADLIVVPGMRFAKIQAVPASMIAWLREAWERGAQIASVCTGAFLLGRAGLLDGRQCTTHWSRIEELKRSFPSARVLDNRLFVQDGPVTTSAGIASGIDMALALLEKRFGPLLVATVAREMVVYLRRDGSHRQQSVYLEYRTHLHPGVHRVQDWLTAHPAERVTLPDLARRAALSPRHLTRVFRQATGVSIQEFTTRLRLELARGLLHDPRLTVDAVATRCGFADARQLRRLWKEVYGTSPGSERTKAAG